MQFHREVDPGDGSGQDQHLRVADCAELVPDCMAGRIPEKLMCSSTGLHGILQCIVSMHTTCISGVNPGVWEITTPRFGDGVILLGGSWDLHEVIVSYRP